MKYFVAFALYCIIAGIVAGIALRNHDKENEEFDDVTKPEMTITVICLLPALFVIMIVGIPLVVTHTWMHGVCKK